MTLLKHQTLLLAVLLACSFTVSAQNVIRINRLGYLPQSVKVAVFLSSEEIQIKNFTLHEASDYLQYSTTSVNTIFQMMFACQNFPEIYGDRYDAPGFALAAELFGESDPEMARLMKQKALDAWDFALSDTGYTQTACNVSPYYYEEKNFADDLELAAIQLYRLTGEEKILKEAEYRGKRGPVSQWIKNDADTQFEGGEHVLQVLEKLNIKGSFFFTGNFLRNPEFKNIIKTEL